MHSANPEPAPHGGRDELSSVLSEVLAADAEVAAAEVRRVRALARAGHLAFDAMAAQRTSSTMAEMALGEVASEIAAAARLSDLLLTATPGADPTRVDDGPGTLGAIRAKVQVVVPALTMLQPGGENLDPAELVGHGPIDAETARAIADATSLPWDRVITHPITGAVLHVDTYKRTAAIDRHLRARDRHCRWPGCIAPAVRCEVDHTHDAARGAPTAVSNLSHLCQRHHTQKQFTRWRVRQLTGGVLEWTSPTGNVYIDEPLPYSPAVRFVPDPPVPVPPVSDPAPF